LIGEKFAIYNGDSIEVMASLPSGSVGMSIYSPPFATKRGCLYQYSSDDRDLSNNDTYQQFFDHYAFMVQQIHRLTMPGRMSYVHCMDTPTGNSGRDGLIDFPGDIIRLHEREGFEYVARYIIWKEPLAVRNRTMQKNLAHKTIVDDSSCAGNAGADYLLAFRREGKNAVPIAHPSGLIEYAGSVTPPDDLQQFRGWAGKQTENRYSHWIWRRYASCIWDDIRIDNVLPYK
jgi:hypothetical protein